MSYNYDKLSETQLKGVIDEINKQIYYTSESMEQLKDILSIVKNELYKKCNHKWISDSHVLSDHTVWICENCKQYKK